MDFQDLEFLPSGDSFYTSFHKNCCRGKILGQPHILELLMVASKGMFPVSYFLCYSNFIEVITLSQRWGKIWPTSVFGILPNFRQLRPSVCHI